MKVNIINTICFKITITHIYFNSCTCITETIAEGEKAETTKNIPPAKKIESDNDGTSSDELGRQHDELLNKTIEMDPDSDRKHPPDTIVVKKVNSMLDREEEDNLMRFQTALRSLTIPINRISFRMHMNVSTRNNAEDHTRM